MATNIRIDLKKLIEYPRSICQGGDRISEDIIKTSTRVSEKYSSMWQRISEDILLKVNRVPEKYPPRWHTNIRRYPKTLNRPSEVEGAHRGGLK